MRVFWIHVPPISFNGERWLQTGHHLFLVSDTVVNLLLREEMNVQEARINLEHMFGIAGLT